MNKNKDYIIEVLENNQKTYFCVNRFFGETKYSFIEDIEKATKFDNNQAKVYTQYHLKDKKCNIIKII